MFASRRFPVTKRKVAYPFNARRIRDYTDNGNVDLTHITCGYDNTDLNSIEEHYNAMKETGRSKLPFNMWVLFFHSREDKNETASRYTSKEGGKTPFSKWQVNNMYMTFKYKRSNKWNNNIPYFKEVLKHRQAMRLTLGLKGEEKVGPKIAAWLGGSVLYRHSSMEITQNEYRTIHKLAKAFVKEDTGDAINQKAAFQHLHSYNQCINNYHSYKSNVNQIKNFRLNPYYEAYKDSNLSDRLFTLTSYVYETWAELFVLARFKGREMTGTLTESSMFTGSSNTHVSFSEAKGYIATHIRKDSEGKARVRIAL